MRIGIDARFYGPIGKGLGRYTQEIVDNIIKMVDLSQVSVVVFLSPENFNEFSISHKNIKKIKIRMHWYSWQEQIFFPWFIWREKLDLIHYPHFNVPVFTPCRFVVTIHDLILTHFPTTRATTHSPLVYYFKNLAYRFVIKQAIKRSQKVITVSNFTKNDILEQFKIPEEKIIVTYEGVANLYKGNDDSFSVKLNYQENNLVENVLKNDFLLYVGNAYPHKNLEFLLRVFKNIREIKPNLRLVLIGKEDYFYNKLRNFALSINLLKSNSEDSPVVFAGYVPDRQLLVFYQKASAYIFPSLYEGFGLPPLEAMAQSCPVISASASSLPEILGQAALYFNPKEEEELKKRVLELLDNESLRSELINKGKEQIKKYSWEECARQTFSVYEQALIKK